MKLYLVSQSVNNNYDTYDAIVVAAENEQDARNVKPIDVEKYERTWVKSANDLTVEEIGIAKKGIKRGTILESFNAG